jgi:hypothetical protein
MGKPTATWQKITPEVAAEWLDANIDNRHMRADAVQAYARDIQEGRWMLTGESIKFDSGGRLIDGQHRLGAIVAAATTVECLVVGGLDPAVQRVIDVNIRRSAGDTLRFLGVEKNVYEVASSARLAIAYTGGHLKRYGTLRTMASHAEIYQWVEEHPEIIEITAESRRLFHKLGVPPSPLTFSMWQLSQIDADDAREFFTSTAEYATEGNGDPRATLMRAYSNDTHRLARRPGTIIGLTFAAWNAWRDKQKIFTLPLVDKKGNSMLIETPL